MSDNDLALLAHLLRRAGFGATRDELEEYAAKGYAAVVDDLLHPERFPEVDEIVSAWPDEALSRLGLNASTAVAVSAAD